MQELDKILEEIDLVKEEIVNLDCGDDYNAGLRDMAMMAKQIIRKYMNDGWIPVEERLPEEWEKVIVWYEYFRYGDYNRMYETYGIGWQHGGHWSGDVSGTKARCIAWHPLPEPYKPKQPETCKYTGGSCCWPIDQCSDCTNNPERSENDQ